MRKLKFLMGTALAVFVGFGIIISMAATPVGTLGNATLINVCGSTISKDDMQNNFVHLGMDGQASVVVAGLHDSSSNQTFINYSVPGGKQLRIFCTRMSNNVADAAGATLGFGDDASTSADASEPTNSILMLGNNTFDDNGLPAIAGHVSEVQVNFLVPPGKFIFVRFDNTAGDDFLYQVYGILEDAP